MCIKNEGGATLQESTWAKKGNKKNDKMNTKHKYSLTINMTELSSERRDSCFIIFRVAACRY